MKNKDWLLSKIIKSKIKIKILKEELNKTENDYYEIKLVRDQLLIKIASLQRQLEGKDLIDIKL
jgi:hypothetical protein